MYENHYEFMKLILAWLGTSILSILMLLVASILFATFIYSLTKKGSKDVKEVVEIAVAVAKDVLEL